MQEKNFNVCIDEMNSIAVYDENGKEVTGLISASIEQDFSLPRGQAWYRGEGVLTIRVIAKIHQSKEQMLQNLNEFQSAKGDNKTG